MKQCALLPEKKLDSDMPAISIDNVAHCLDLMGVGSRSEPHGILQIPVRLNYVIASALLDNNI